VAEDPGIPDDVIADRRQWVNHQAQQSGPRWRKGQVRMSAATQLLWRRRPNHHHRHRTWASRSLHRLGDVSAHAGAGLVVAAVVGVWLLVGVATSFPDWWETVLYSSSSTVTLVMVFAIQHTQSRHQSAIQRKLDELVRSQPAADDQLIAAEDAPHDELEARAVLNIADRQRASAPPR